MSARVIACYSFLKIPETDLAQLRADFIQRADELDIHGLMILGVEGINCTLSGDSEPLETFLALIKDRLKIDRIALKESIAERHPFKHFKCKIRREIVTTHDLSIDATEGQGTHLTAQEWHQALQDENAIVLDTRNSYETRVGKFRQAIDPQIRQFPEFEKYLEGSDLPKDKKILIYCTGGIRCEKAMVEMHRRGFNQVFQLEGGILNYLKEFPQGEFAGECFVFDYRVALDPQLTPTTRYRLCPHCGQPGDLKIKCKQCGEEGVICDVCQEQADRNTCSKNCANHFRLGHRSRKQQKRPFKSVSQRKFES